MVVYFRNVIHSVPDNRSLRATWLCIFGNSLARIRERAGGRMNKGSMQEGGDVDTSMSDY